MSEAGALSISEQSLQEAAQILVDAGVTAFKKQWRGILVVHQEGREQPAAEALELVLHMVQGIRGAVPRRMLLDELEIRVRALAKVASAGTGDVEVIH